MSKEFDGAGKKLGLEVWRIEKLVPVAVPKKMHGQFYDGDSYIILKTHQPSGNRGPGAPLVWDIFFWLGENSSKDEQGVAAYKTVELDEALGGSPTQHREVQGHESDQFMQSFKKVEYLKGGVASGFKHVERDKFEPRLLHVKGARSVRVSTVPLAAASLNSGDVFVLDLGMRLVQWNGKEANRKEKAKALDVCHGIRDDERGGKASIDACDEGSEPDEFWKGLGGKGKVAAAVADATNEKSSKGVAKLYRVSDASGSMSTTEIASGSLKRELLDTKDVFLLDTITEIFVWVGKGASQAERKKGMAVGEEYCTQAARPKGTRVTKVVEGTETTAFKSNFASWSSTAAGSSSTPVDFSSPGGGTKRGSIAKSGSMSGSDAVAAMDLGAIKRQKAEKKALADDGNGVIDVWRIEGFEAVKVDESLEGKFYSGDSYVVKYTYQRSGKEMHILYFWLGSSSSNDEKGAAALHAKKMDDQVGGAATQVRVVMGKEPDHFVRCFHGRLVIHSGGKASGFKNRADSDAYDLDGTSLFHVRVQRRHARGAGE